MTDILSDVKQDQNITWDTEDDALIQMIQRAEYKLNEYAGTKVDYQTDLDARQLLLDFCRYIRNKVSEEFEKNYTSDLIMLRARYQIKLNNASHDADPDEEQET